jgi:hypothetical protein
MATPHRIDLPGLVGDEPLAFLAAIGLNTLLLDGILSWDPNDRHAILHCDRHSSVADLVATLIERLMEIREGQAIPFTDGFPIRRRRGGPDPLRITPLQYRSLDRKLNGHGGARSWLAATLTDRATDEKGLCLVNPLIALRGRQTIGSFWHYPMVEVRKDPQRLLTEALTGWRRVPDADGWLLDHHASYSQDSRLRSHAGSMAVPGATWLATLALGTFGYGLLGGSNCPPDLPPGWFRVDDSIVFAWPLWTLPIGGDTLSSVLNVGWGYGDWHFERTGDGGLNARISATHGVRAPNSIDHTVDLDIFAMCAATRPAHDVPLIPVPVHLTRVPDPRRRESSSWPGWDWNVPDLGDYPGRYGHG